MLLEPAADGAIQPYEKLQQYKKVDLPYPQVRLNVGADPTSHDIPEVF